MSTVHRVFLASAKGVLVEYRRAVVEVCQRIGLTAVHMDQFYPDELAPIDVCRQYVETADAVVLIVAHRYGSRPPGESLSFTELEYEHALAIGRPVYPWVADEQYWATAHPDDHYDDEAATRRFVDRLTARHTVKALKDVADFKLDLTARLSVLMGRHGGHAPFSFGGRTHADPHALAVAMTTDWASATDAFASVHARTALVGWLRHEVGDRTYPTNLLTRPLTDHTDVDVAILDFIAHFAPDLRPTYRGSPMDVPGLAAICAQAVDGDAGAVALLSRLTGAMMERFARHRCQAGHDGCGAGGCAVLRGAWRVTTASLDALAAALPSVGALTTAFPSAATYFGQPLERFAGLAHWGLNDPRATVVALALAATAMRAAVGPAYLAGIEREYRNLARVPRPPWWDRLRARAETASGAERTALVVATTVLAPIAAERARRLTRRRLFIGIGSVAFLGLAGTALCALIEADRLVRTLTGHTDAVYSVAWSPDGSRLASASYDETVRVWRADSGDVVRTLTGHTNAVGSVAWSPDGSRLASASGDKTVRVWRADSGDVVRTLTGHTAWVGSVAWSPDGSRLASASRDKTVRVWRA